ncbi:MAG TPA: MoaD/ThiS family protein [Gemmatimonadaceae bacterium]|jgi:molybdopterin converting factor small subunit
MPITIEIPSPLRVHSHGNAIATIDTAQRPCPSVREALGALATQYPRVVDSVITEQGDLRPHVNVFVDNENTRYTDGLRTPVKDSSTITILAAISGG